MAAVYGQRRTRKMANGAFIINVFHLVCACWASLDLQGQAFIQTDNELRYMIDTGVASSLHNSHDPNIPDVSVVRFDPPVLNFGEQPVGMPFMEQVTVENLDPQTSLHLLSISGSTLHFHCSFFQDKLVPPLGNTTFEVVFLARQVGSVENTLYIHSSKGSFKYQVFGVGVQNPYRIRPFLGARVPINSSFSPLIRMYNPHGTILQVEEIYTSGGDLHLELPTGEQEAPKDLWEIPPFETKSIMKASFLGRIEHNHTAFIRIKTNKDNKQEMLILPVEVEVTSAPGIYSPTEMLDFGILRTLDEPSVLRLSLINSGLKPIQITNITVQSPNSAVHIDFRPTQVKPGVLLPTSVALVSFTASLAVLSQQWSGKIIIKSKSSQYKLTIPYQAHVLHGSLVYDRNKTMFYTGESPATKVTHDFSITNTFNFTLVIYNISVHPSLQSLFTITNFSRPCLIGPGQSLSVFNLTFHPNSSMLHLVSEIYLHTNTSVFKIPLHVYSGHLKVIHHRPEIFKGQLDFGTMAVMEKRVMNFTLRNDNPVDIIISKYYSNMERTVVSLLGVERGNGTILSGNCNSSKLETGSLILKPYHIAVFSVELTAPDREGTFSAEVIISTQFEHLYMPMTLLTATGSLRLIPDRLVLTRCFPGKISSLDVRVHSTFPHQIKLRDIAFTPNDARFYYMPSKDKHPVLSPGQETVIGHLFFDPRRECKDDCYVTLPTHIPAGHTWLLGSTLDKEVTDTDQYLFTRFRQKWEHLETSQTSIVNITLQLDTNQVRGFLFPAQANLQWPTIVKRQRIKFHLTQIGNISICEFVLENPTDIPVVVHVVPVALYPNAQTLIDTIGPFLPPDVAQDYVELDDEDSFSLLSLTESQNLRPIGGPLVSMRRHVETSLGVRTNKSTLAFVLPSRTKIPIEVAFQPKDDVLRNSLFIIRNNLTIIETVFLQGQGGLAELRLSNRKPGSLKPLMFEMTDKHLKSCDKKMQSKNSHPNFTVKRMFTLRNTGQLSLYLHGFYIGNSPCEGYGFKILDCVELELPPNSSHKIDIVFTPDFTMSRIRQVLTLHTSLGSAVNFSLQATIPTHMLTQCAASLPRPPWEPLLYYAVLLAMGFLLLCVALAAYFEAERLFTADVIKRRSELNQMAFDRSKVFDLKAFANFKLPSDSSKISSNLYMSRRLGMAPASATAAVTSHPETVRASSSGASHPPHRRESWWLRMLRRLAFWQSSAATGTVLPDGAKYSAAPDAAKAVGAAGTIAVANEKTVGKTGLGKGLGKYISESYVVRSALRRIWKCVVPKRFTSSKSAKSAARPPGDQKKDLNVSDADANADQIINSPPSLAPNAQKKNSDQEHHKRQLDAKPVLTNKEKNFSTPQSTGSTAPGNNTQASVSDEPQVSKKEVQKGQKVRKTKALDLKRVNKKRLENEKADKDDSSSTTTETSSIEADDKNASPRGGQENEEKTRTKKIRSKTRQKEGTKSILPEDIAATPLSPPSVLDEFLLTATKQVGKSGRKSKANQNHCYSPNTQKSCSPDQSGAAKPDPATAPKENKPKQVCLPLTAAETATPSATTVNRKKTNKTKTPGQVGQVCNGNRCYPDSYQHPSSSSSSSSSSVVLWDMPQRGCAEEHDGLSELAAQTDLFARTYSLPATAVTSKPAHEPSPSLPNHSSYSSVMNNAVRITDHQNHHQMAMSNATRPSLDGLLTTVGPNAVDSLVNANRQQSNALNSIPATGGMPSRPGSSRPVAAVGATVRRSWPANFNHGHSMCDEITSGMCQSGFGEMDLSLAGGNRLMFDDPAIMAGFGLGLNQSCFPPQEGYDLYGYGPSMMSNPMEHQQTTPMQRLQAERRKRLHEYELKKQHACGNEWPGFDLPTPMSPDPWEQTPLLSNPWGPPSTPLGGVRPSSGPAGIWNAMGTTTPDNLRWMGNIWSSPEPETKLTSPGPSDLVEEMSMGSSTGGGATATHNIFDPFNALEIRSGSIWNPTSTGSGVMGWGFGMKNPGDGGSMK